MSFAIQRDPIRDKPGETDSFVNFKNALSISQVAFKLGEPPPDNWYEPVPVITAKDQPPSPPLSFLAKVQPPGGRSGKSALRDLVDAGCNEQLVLACATVYAAPDKFWKEWTHSLQDQEAFDKNIAGVRSAIDRLKNAMLQINPTLMEGYGLEPVLGVEDYTRLWNSLSLVPGFVERAPESFRRLRRETQRNFSRNQAVVVLAEHARSQTGSPRFKEAARLVIALSERDIEKIPIPTMAERMRVTDHEEQMRLRALPRPISSFVRKKGRK